eukprot:TRINITY_DN18045_c0_g1_i1.p1 TRINITY_DN18045_c0_g1~~TRINITY_DN18045_c0_g1_i1.p1  ORF type:complete len:104 (-),score=34.78 TRINITY_DN18045_c0_g1_i1:157-468(-)
MESTQERSPSFGCFENLLNPENWETYRLPPDVTSFEEERELEDDEDLASEVLEEDSVDVSPFKKPVIDELEEVIKVERASFKPRRKIIKCQFKAASAELGLNT